MRVAYLPGSFRPDRCGVSHYTARLMAELSARGVACNALTCHEAAAACRRPWVMGITPGWGAQLLTHAPRAMRHLDADILHIQHAAGSYGFRRAVFGLIPALRLAGWRRPIIVTAHEYGWWTWQPRLRGPWPLSVAATAGRAMGWAWQRLAPWGEARTLWDREDFFLLTGADAVIVTNDAAAKVLSTRLPGIQGRAQRIPIGANIPLLATDRPAARAALRRRYGWGQATPVISFFGFLHPVKGIETLLAAFARVHEALPEARLLLNGGAESLALRGGDAQGYEAGLRAMVGRLGLAEAVQFTGYLPEQALSENLAGSDVGVLPFNAGVTAKSGSLLALWEHGLPVVATQSDATEPELAQACRAVPCRDADALARALISLLQNPAQQQELAAAGRRAVAGFSWEEIAAAHLDIYRRLLPAG